MEIKENVIAQADIRYNKTKFAKTITILYFVIVALSLIIGIATGSRTYHSDGGRTIYGDTYPAHDNTYIGWYGVDFYENSQGWKEDTYGWYADIANPLGNYWGTTTETHVENIAMVCGLYVVLFGLPIVLNSSFKKQCQVSSFTVTDTHVYVSYDKETAKKNMKMPIQKVQKFMIMNKSLDKLRSGETLCICTDAGVIELHFVHNAKEVSSATVARIKEMKEEKKAKVAVETTPIASSTTSDKLKELVSMKEQGLISEEEYNMKREDILAKM